MRTLLIQGERGIGKSRLLEEWCESLGRQGVPVMLARGRPWSASIPLQVIGDAISQYLSGLAPEQAEQVLGEEDRLLAAAVPMLQVRRVLEAGSRLEPSREMVFAGLLAVLERIACEAPAVLAIDDLHLAHQASRDWLSYVRHYLPRLKLLVLATWPEAEPVSLEGFDQILQLGPLGIEVAAELVGPERASALHARTGGNPRFLLELASSNSEQAPDSLVAAVSGSLQKLQEASGTVRAAAVLGTDLDLLAEVLELPHGTLLDHLQRAYQARILVHGAAQLRFSSELLREAVLLSTPTAWQALVHRHAARILIRRRSPDLSLITVHADAARKLSG
jgi:predicted ATPase